MKKYKPLIEKKESLIENLLTCKNPIVREKAKKLSSLQFPVTYYNVGVSADFWTLFTFIIHLPKGYCIELWKDHSINNQGWYCEKVLNKQRWGKLKGNFTFEEVLEKVKTIINDLYAIIMKNYPSLKEYS